MQYIMVDEFQDVSQKQYRIAQILSAKHKNLFIVGDADQTIYSWRGSHVRMILDFDKKYPEAKTFVLKQNYRSTPEILKASNELISKNTVRYPKELVANCKSGPKPKYFHAPSEIDEAKWLADQIILLHNQQKIPFGNIAVLYRAHYLSRPLEETFISNDIPYKILAGVEFYGRREIKDIVCYLRMLTAQDDISFYRTVNVPSRKIGKTKLAAIKQCALQNDISAFQALKKLLEQNPSIFKGTKAQEYVDAIQNVRQMLPKPESTSITLHKQASLGDILQAIMDQSGYEAFLRLEADQERLDNVAEFKRSVNQAGLDDDASLENLLNHIALFTDLDRNDKADTVKLLTIHAAKGMEYDNVFLFGMNEGVFPSRKVNTPDDMEEERRIAYVAMTRAKNQLFITDSEGKANDGLFKYPSRFIFNAGLENLDVIKPLDQELVKQATNVISTDEKRLVAMSKLLKVGQRVSHPVFGPGTITLVNQNAFCYMVKFDGIATERSIQFSAKLSLIE